MLQRAKPLPGWLYQDTLTSTEANFIQTEYIKAVDGYGGGYYPNVNIIEFGGVLKIPYITGDTEFFGNVKMPTVNGPVAYNGTATYNDDLIVNGNIYIGNAPSDAMSVNSQANFANTVIFQSPISINSTAHMQVGSRISYVNNGRALQKGLITSNSNQTIDITQYQYIHIPTAVNATRTYTLNGSVMDGDFVTIYNQSLSSQIITGLFSVPVLPAQASIMYMRISGTWVTIFNT